jgi:hypothetical protein
MWASGARSPLAPTEPWRGTRGVTPAASIPSMSATTAGETPEAPRPRLRSLRAIMRRVVGTSSGAPTPAEWLRMRLRWSAAVSPGATRTLASLPKPVLTP